MTAAPHLLLVEARYYTHISDLLRRGAERALAEAGATFEAVAVPGAFELPGRDQVRLAIGAVRRLRRTRLRDPRRDEPL